MLASVRAGFAAALVALAVSTAFASDKPFQRSDLADSAIRLDVHVLDETERHDVTVEVGVLDDAQRVENLLVAGADCHGVGNS